MSHIIPSVAPVMGCKTQLIDYSSDHQKDSFLFFVVAILAAPNCMYMASRPWTPWVTCSLAWDDSLKIV